MPDHDQVVQRGSVGDDRPHGSSESKAPQILSPPLKIVETIEAMDAMGLEKTIQSIPRPESEQLAQLPMREMAEPELVDRQRLQPGEPIDCSLPFLRVRSNSAHLHNPL
jgi:hypothetical protein